MKKIILFLATVFITSATFAQADVTSAFNAKKNGKFEDAATFIEKALGNAKAIAKEKTWRYRGDIYLGIALDSTLFAKYPNALTLSKDSYLKAKEIDKKGSWHEEDNKGLADCHQQSLNMAYTSFTSQDFPKAGDFYLLAADIISGLNSGIDTVSIYSAGIAYDNGNVDEKAIECFQKCGEYNYEVPNVYFFISRIQKRMGDEEKALQTIIDARKKHPNNSDLLIEELNYYLINNRHEEAKENLTSAIKLDPENKILHFSLGTIHDKLEESEDAIAAYKAAIAIDGNYTDALYNLGALYYNKGVSAVKLYNDLPPGENTKMEALNKEIDENFGACMPFLEKAHAITPDDIAIMETLKNVYAQIGEDEKYLDIKTKLEK